MKVQKKLNVVLTILVIVLISLISFGGIYYKSKNEMANYLPDYKLGEDLKGYRRITLEVDETEDDSENVTSGESEITIGGGTDENTTTENTINSNSTESKYSSNDFKKSADIFKKRLKSLKVESYTVSYDKSTGKIEITIPENDQTDTILSDLVEIGEFSIKDSSTNEVLLSNADVSRVDVGIIDYYSSTKAVRMNIQFDVKGTRTLKNITETYQNKVAENIIAENELSSTNTNDEDGIVDEPEELENITNNTTSDSGETTDTPKTTVKMYIDDSEILETYFTDIIDTGILSLTMGSSESDDEIETILYSASNIKAIIENEPLPVEYSITRNVYVNSIVNDNEIKAIICIEIAIALVIALLLIIKYRKNGLLATIILIGFVALLLIVLRYTNVIISLQGLLGILIAFVSAAMFSYMLCKKLDEDDLNEREREEAVNSTIKGYCLAIIPELIIAVVCCFNSLVAIFSLGMIMFWGILIGLIYNIILSKFLVN